MKLLLSLLKRTVFCYVIDLDDDRLSDDGEALYEEDTALASITRELEEQALQDLFTYNINDSRFNNCVFKKRNGKYYVVKKD
ncbi:MAG: hypothetical protein LBF71_02760 [Campylobacteraceae bacterium]|jgi:hypothetical protein|nr:hypothetical protein [Campylobacteraceae bacterium]